jgi:hypothetical protein
VRQLRRYRLWRRRGVQWFLRELFRGLWELREHEWLLVDGKLGGILEYGELGRLVGNGKLERPRRLERRLD